MSAGEIADRFSCSWPTTTRHLNVLKAAELIFAVRRGRERVYALRYERLGLVGEWLAWFEKEHA